VRGFFSHCLDTLVGARATPASFHGRARKGYSFGERYWASLTRTCLPPRGNDAGINTLYGEASSSLTAVISRPKPERQAAVQEEDYLAHLLCDPELIRRLDREARRGHLGVRNARTFVIAIVSGAILAAAAAASVVASNLAEGNQTPPAPTAIASGIMTFAPATGRVRGVIFLPQSGPLSPSEVRNSEISASGEIQSLRPQHHLWLFIRYRQSGNYYPADQAAHVFYRGWTGDIHIRNRGPASIILADLGPQAYERLIGDPAAQVTGFPDLHFAPGVTVIDSVAITIK
jgi:hypothetical protein